MMGSGCAGAMGSGGAGAGAAAAKFAKFAKFATAAAGPAQLGGGGGPEVWLEERVAVVERVIRDGGGGGSGCEGGMIRWPLARVARVVWLETVASRRRVSVERLITRWGRRVVRS